MLELVQEYKQQYNQLADPYGIACGDSENSVEDDVFQKDLSPKIITTSPRDSEKTSEDEIPDAELVRLELQEVLTVFKKKPSLEFLRTPLVYINSKSSPKEVQQWLQQKAFSERTANQLKWMNGEEMFNLTKIQAEQLCGKEEGKRLYSQLLIQRNESGWKTMRSAELCQKLAKARAKAEQDIQEQNRLNSLDGKHEENHKSEEN